MPRNYLSGWRNNSPTIMEVKVMWGLNSTRAKNQSVNGLRFAALTIGLGISAMLTTSSARAVTITACVNTKSGAVTIISGGACKKGTTGVVLNGVPSNLTVQTLTAQNINVVDASNKTRASLAANSNGNLLTFFDSGGQKTLSLGINQAEDFAGGVTWDNNKVIPGTGSFRMLWGESNPNAGSNAGFGMQVYDASETLRAAIGPVYDLSDNGLLFRDANGVQDGFGVFHSNGYAGYYVNDSTPKTRQFAGFALDSSYNNIEVIDSTGALAGLFVNPNFKDFGYFLNDLNGVNRQFVGESLDGTSFNVVQLDDSNAAPRTGINQGPFNGFFTQDSNGTLRQSVQASDDGSAVLYNSRDRNGKTRTGDGFTDQNGPGYSVFDANGNDIANVP